MSDLEPRAEDLESEAPAARAPLEVRLPRWRRVGLVLLVVDALFLAAGWTVRGDASSTRALVVASLALLAFVGFLIQVFAWVTVIAFFARGRAREGSIVAWLLLLELAILLALLWLVRPALA